jgi:hypothetical protein
MDDSPYSNNKLLNPRVKITRICVRNRKGFAVYVVRDDLLPGGTKQRIMEAMFDSEIACRGKAIPQGGVIYSADDAAAIANLSPIKNDIHEFVYAGPVQGYAQIAISQVAADCKKRGKNYRATLFLENKNKSALTRRAATYGPKIVEVPRVGLWELRDAAKEYVDDINKKNVNRSDKSVPKTHVYLFKLGLFSETCLRILANQIRDAWGDNHRPHTMWLVAGSATILNSLYLVFPDTFFNVVQVGKKILPDQINPKKTKLYISDERFSMVARIQPPYPTVATYDAKLWKYVLKYGRNGDYIWNVGRDVASNSYRR